MGAERGHQEHGWHLPYTSCEELWICTFETDVESVRLGGQEKVGWERLSDLKFWFPKPELP